MSTEVKAGKVVVYKDRLARFGFDHLKHEATITGCGVLTGGRP